MSAGRISAGRIIVRLVEVVLAVAVLALAIDRLSAGKLAAAANNAIIGVAIILVIEALLWLVRVRSRTRWSMSSNELLFRGVQLIITVTMIADALSRLVAGEGFGVNLPGCLLAIVILQGIIQRFIRPDPRPPVMAQALKSIQANVKVFTQLPPEKVRETLGLVRGISDIEASSRLGFELAEQEALYVMLKQARELGANAVVDARLTTGTYETTGSQWQVSRPVYTGTAVRI